MDSIIANPALQHGQLLFHQRRFDLAENSLRQALAQSPNDAYAHALLGLCLVELKKFHDARAETDLAVLNAPDSSFSHYAQGIVLQNCNRFPEAQAAAKTALNLDPENIAAWALLAHTLISQQQWLPALEAADHGLAIDPEDADCNNLRAMTLIHLGEKQTATQSIDGVLQRNPLSAVSHANQGWAYLHDNNPTKALEHFREALKLNPNFEWARDGMTEALKARYLPYRLMLRYNLWMSGFTRRGRWFIILGAWLGYQLLRAVKAANPDLAPLVYPILVAYVLFLLSSWLFSPLFNLTLLPNRFARYLLSTSQVIFALLVGLSLFAALVFVPIGYLADNILFGIGMIFGFLALPLAATASCRPGAHMRIMSVFTAITAILGFIGVFMLENRNLGGLALFIAVGIACGLSSVAANILRTIIPKKA